jgi:hypothetical protein
MTATVLTVCGWLLVSAIVCPLLGAVIALRELKGK